MEIERQSGLTFDDLKNLPPSQGVLFLCDNEGKITRMINEGPERFHRLFPKLFGGGNIRDLFDLKGVTDLDAMQEGAGPFPERASPRVDAASAALFCALPIATLSARRLEKGRYLCVVRVSDIFPNFFPEKTGSIIYTDSEDRLVGFNSAFYTHFRETCPLPEKMLREPVDRFITPTPRQLQEQGLSAFDISAEGDFKAVLTRHFSEEGIRGAFESMPADLPCRAAPAGLACDNTKGSKAAFLICLEKIDTHASDFMVRLKYSSPPGQEPFFTLGPPPGSGRGVLDGYLMGRSRTDPGLAILRRRGFTAAAYPWPSQAGGARDRELVLARSGRGLYLYADNRKCAAWYDYLFLHDSEARVAVGLRPGCSAELKRFTLMTRKTQNGNGDMQSENILVLLRTQGKRHFLLSRFDNHALSEDHPGVSGYLLQDITDLQRRVHTLEGEYERTLKEGRELKSLVDTFRRDRDAFIGQSPQIAAIKDKVKVVAESKATILIEGPTGTGKEVLARYIHSLSGFRNGPFIKVDCSTLPRDLMESELFGHEAGAFTGAVGRKIGMVEQANRGTLFLDEVANLTLETQAKLLQFLQDFTIYRIGGQKPITLDLRVIGASNIRLSELTRRGLFREDLYYRLCVIDLLMPSLSERIEDLPELCAHFLELFRASSGKRVLKLSPRAFEKMRAHSWPGNIRELKNVIQRAVLFCQTDEITEDLVLIHDGAITEGAPAPAPAASGPGGTEPQPEAEAQRKGADYHLLTKMSREEFVGILKKHKGNIAGVTRELKVTRRALYYHLERLGIDITGYRAG